MLRFTVAGVVGLPDTVQVRVQQAFPGRVQAGAPQPSRSLTDAEVLESLRFFTEGQRGPRARPCVAVVLSGLDGERATSLGPAIAAARAWGVRRIVLHVDGEGVAPIAVDVVTRVVRTASDVARLGAWQGVERQAVLLLEVGGLEGLEARVRELISAGVGRVALSWPFPPAAVPAPVGEVQALLDVIGPLLDAGGVPWTIKGLPACLAGAHAARTTRTANRWYVDADHQGERALLFRPDILRLHKPELCRFCDLDGSCDGVAEAWVRQGHVRALLPIQQPAQ